MSHASIADLARDMLEVPEAVLARPSAPVTLELAFACALKPYAIGELYLQALFLRARDKQDRRRHAVLNRLAQILRAEIVGDAMEEPVVDAGDFLPRRGQANSAVLQAARAE